MVQQIWLLFVLMTLSSISARAEWDELRGAIYSGNREKITNTFPKSTAEANQAMDVIFKDEKLAPFIVKNPDVLKVLLSLDTFDPNYPKDKDSLLKVAVRMPRNDPDKDKKSLNASVHLLLQDSRTDPSNSICNAMYTGSVHNSDGVAQIQSIIRSFLKNPKTDPNIMCSSTNQPFILEDSKEKEKGKWEIPFLNRVAESWWLDAQTLESLMKDSRTDNKEEKYSYDALRRSSSSAKIEVLLRNKNYSSEVLSAAITHYLQKQPLTKNNESVVRILLKEKNTDFSSYSSPIKAAAVGYHSTEKCDEKSNIFTEILNHPSGESQNISILPAAKNCSNVFGSVLQRKNIDVNEVDSENNNILHLMAKDCPCGLKLAIEKVDLNQKNKQGHTPAFIAAESGSLKSLKILLTHSGISDGEELKAAAEISQNREVKKYVAEYLKIKSQKDKNMPEHSEASPSNSENAL